MASKEVTDRARSTTAAANMLESYADSAADGARALLSPFLREGETMPDFGLGLQLLARLIRRRAGEMEAADSANEREQADDAKPRADRDRYGESAFELIITIRDSVGANFGQVGLAALGLSDPAPGTPHGRARYGRALVTALRNPEIALPRPRSASISLDRAALADELEQEIGALEAALGDVSQEESEGKGTQAAKDQAVEANDGAFSLATGFGRQLFRLCGLTDLADRIRESPARPGRLDTPPAPTPEDAGGPIA